KLNLTFPWGGSAKLFKTKLNANRAATVTERSRDPSLQTLGVVTNDRAATSRSTITERSRQLPNTRYSLLTRQPISNRMLSVALRRLWVLPLLLLLAGLCGATLLRFAPGFGVDERELDARFSSETIARIREPQAGNVVAYYAQYLKSAIRGDLGVSR